MPRHHHHRKHHIWIALAVLVLGCLVLYGKQQGWIASAGKTIEGKQPGMYSIDHFIDGDTIAVNMNGQVESVRFIGVDTPETHKPNTPVQCFGPNAAKFTQKQIGKRRVRLVSDSLSTNRDRYNRLLRYVYLPDGTNLDERIILNGYGFYYPYFPFSKSAQFSAAEQQAIHDKKGLWNACHPTPTDSGGYISNPA